MNVDIGKITLGLVSILIAILIIAMVAIPVIEDSQKGTPYEGDNTGGSTNMAYVTDQNWTIVRAGSTVTTTIGTGSTAKTDSYTISGTVWGVISDKFMVRFQSAGTGFWDWGSNTYYNSTSPATVTVTIACTSGTVSITNDASENALNKTISNVGFTLMKFASGEWTRYSGPINATLGQEVIYGNLPLQNDTTGPIRLYKTVDGGAPETIIAPSTYYGTAISASSIDSQVIHYEEIGGKQAVGSYDGVTTKWTDGGTQKTSESIYMWVPIHFESTYEADAADTNSILMGVIPIVLILVTIMMAVKMLGVRD